ncbi:MAG: PDZ domain-containing protein [Pseudomonadota bacterium]
MSIPLHVVAATACLLFAATATSARAAASDSPSRAEAGAREQVAAAQGQGEAAKSAASDAARAAQEAELERQLAAARERLEAAAREVATLSTQLAGADVLRFRVGPPGAQRRALLGVQLGESRPQGGVRVAGVSPGGPAAAAGIREGDVIVRVEGQSARDAAGVARIVRSLEPGASAKLDLERDGRPRSVVVVTRELDPGVVLFAGPQGFDVPAPDFGELPLRLPFERFRPWADLELATLTKDLGRYFGADRGVLVVRAPADASVRLRDGDVVTAIDGREPQSASHALRILRSYREGEKLTLAVLRDRKPLRLEVTVPRVAPGAPPVPAVPRAPGVPAAPPAAAGPA